MRNELEMVLKVLSVISFEDLLQYLPGKTWKDHGKPKTLQLVFRLRFEMLISRI